MSKNFARVVRSMTDTQFERFYRGVYRRAKRAANRNMRFLHVVSPQWHDIINACLDEHDRREG